MELLFVALAGVVIGLIARYSMPRRHTHGVALVPAVATASAAVIWVALTWAGLKWNGGWIWLITLVATAVIAFALAAVIGPARHRADERMLARLSRGAVNP